MVFHSRHFQNEMKLFILQTKAILFAALLKLLQHHEAEEVMQEAYFKVYIERKKGLHITKQRPLLFKIAKNLAISRLRHQTVENKNKPFIREWNAQCPPSPSSEQLAIKREQKQELLEAVNTLPPICRQVFILRKIDELTHQEIAQTLAISKKTVENHLTKGMHLCRKYLLNKSIQKPLNNQQQTKKA